MITNQQFNLPRASLRLAQRTVGVILVAVVWQIVAVALHSSVFPTFMAALTKAIDLVRGPTLVSDIVPSIGRALGGFLIAGVLGVLLGMLIGQSRKLFDWCGEVIDFLRSLPTPLLVPVAVVIFGLNGKMVVATIISAAIWPVLINTINATISIDPTMSDTARAYGLGGWSYLRQLVLPAASPQIFAGLRVSLSVSLAVLVVAEILGGGSGIGYYIANAQQSFNISGSYGGVLILCTLGWLFDTIFVAIEHRILSWQRGVAGRDQHV